MQVLLFRHAQTNALHPTDPDSTPLNAYGHRTAKALRSHIKGRNLDRIVSSPAERTWRTVEPIASQRRMEILATSDVRSADGFFSMLRDLDTSGASAILACTHREALQHILPELLARSGDKPTAALFRIAVEEGIETGAGIEFDFEEDLVRNAIACPHENVIATAHFRGELP